MAYLELQDLRKRFGTYTALDNISISLEEGEFLSLLGPSGCGKTTALRIVAGFLQADSGTRRDRRRGHVDARAQPPRHRHGLPGLQPVPQHDRGAERRVRAEGAQVAERQARRARRASCSRSSASAHAVDRYPHSSRAACSSASPWRARSRSSRACCCSTSRSRRSTRSCACSCARRSGACRRSSASRPCT